MKYIVELVWNREFNWSYYKSYDNLIAAIIGAESIRDSGDGARVKKVRVSNTDTDKVEWNG